ncbi:MAG: hypothetical protein IJS15_10515 [Victivallales bacterium]|nr:hypothetical protein [Victivallales bacterium]
MEYKILSFSIDTNDGDQKARDCESIDKELNQLAAKGWRVGKMSTSPSYIPSYDYDENGNDSSRDSYCGESIVIIMEKE